MVFRIMAGLVILFAFIYVCKKIWFGWLKDFIAKEATETEEIKNSDEENLSESK